MKKIILPVLLVLIAAGLFGLYYFRNSLPAISSVMHSNGPVWNYDKAIASPITGKSGSLSDVTLGAVATNGVSMTVPKGSFDTDTSIQLQTPASVPSYTSASMTPAGTPIEVTASTKTRLNDQTMITIRFDQTKLPKGTQADHMRVAYYDGTVWEFITPTSVDMSAGTMTFGTYHFSLFGPSVASDATIKKSWVHTQALTNQLKNPPGKASDIVAGQIITLTLEKMGVTDPAAAEKVRQNLEADPNYARIASTYTNNDEVMVTNIAKIVGTKIAEEVPKEMFTNHTLQHAGETPGDVAAVAKAVGYISEGNYTEAAKEIGEQIADKFIITTAGKIAIEVTKAQIANWKDGEIEAAYQAYKNGADAKFYGYNVDKGDFQAVWDQMRGIRRQLELEAVNEENKAREEAELPPLTDEQTQSLKDKLMQSYKQQFTLRNQREDVITKEEDKLNQIMSSFEKAGFLGVTAPSELDNGLALDNKMDVLNHFAEKMMSDTNRFDISDKTGLLVNGKLSLEDLVQGARFYFSGPDGKTKYQAFLKDRFGINPFPKLSDIQGAWDNGSMTITDVILSDELKKEIADGKPPKDDGCDFTMDFSALKGKTVPFTFTITSTSDTAGNMEFTSQGQSPQTMPFTYTDGVIAATMSQKGAVGTITMTISEDANAYAATGTMKVDYKSGMVVILASVTASKGKSK